MGDDFIMNTKLAILRMNMNRSDFKVAPPRSRVEDRLKPGGKMGKEDRKRGKPD